MDKQRSNRPLYIVLSVLIAVALWLYVDNVENPDVETTIRDIPVSFIGENDALAERGLMVVEGKDATVDLKLQGKRNTISRVDKENIQIRVDLSDVESVGTKNLAYDVVFSDNVLSSSISILSRSSNYVRVVIDKMSTKTVPVRGVFDGNVADGYVADEFIFSPGTVEISGQEALVSKVEYAQVTLSRIDVSETITDTLGYSLRDADGNEIVSDNIREDPATVFVTLPIVVVKDVPLDVTFIESPGSTKDDMTYSVEPSTISISGEAEDLKNIDSISLAAIDLSKILVSSDLLYNITLPAGINNLSGVSQATVHIRLSGLPTRTYDATRIILSDVPEGYSASLVTQSVQVTIRGPEESLNTVSPEKIHLVADLKDIGATGRYTVSAKAYLDGYDDAGPVGEYKVVVSITS
ncbi:CdaR family protein [Papillibacter cinnamivorans]|uniref:YbbR domain-containing protein n=1 Tax=Papillibacter cinnamivorans DSM 12816 TaxID=1122930 RepID=A0A1W1YV92_9FIRM|nr:CdaR family protein [Papillibacter cinnamivorans]SMC40135.1 YbbR domain-containing protein [Papillibacter cinnamivorans DSM 12816]